MTINMTYRNALLMAVGLHILLLCFLMMDNHSEQFVVHSSSSSDRVENKIEMNRPEAQPIQAVSVDSQAVTDTLNRLKNERAQKEQAELNHQRAMQEQLRVAQQQRIREQHRLEQMKKEAAQLAITQQKKLAAEKQRMRELAEQKALQERHLANLKQQQIQLQKQQAQEKQRLTESLQKQQKEDAAAKAERALVAQEEARRKAQQIAQQQAAQEQQRSAQMSGEVNKYKALIIQAISQHWILPDHVDPQLFSQFRIQLAPTGKVLSVSLIKSSGDPVLDRSAQAAIYKASPLPVPSDSKVFNLFRDISLTVRPQSTRG